MKDDLVRIEYKLDLIMHALKDQGVMITDLPHIRGIEEDVCPVCGGEITLEPDYKKERLQYCCGCELPRTIVPGISGLLDQEDKTDGDSRNSANEVLQQEAEGGSDS